MLRMPTYLHKVLDSPLSLGPQGCRKSVTLYSESDMALLSVPYALRTARSDVLILQIEAGVEQVSHDSE